MIHIFEAAEIPNYNELYKIINEEIEYCNSQTPALVSWWSQQDNEQRTKARSALKDYRTPSIQSIKDPSKLTWINYPAADDDFFDKDSEKVQNHLKIDNKKSGKWTFSMKGIKRR